MADLRSCAPDRKHASIFLVAISRNCELIQTSSGADIWKPANLPVFFLTVLDQGRLESLSRRD
jgi:hypothetical protein